ncbi:MAG: insulinase family protein [candidate division Zixibacteria bacterium]|nr:insulinase family protein [candidate division Zixibacteria bacterium]
MKYTFALIFGLLLLVQFAVAEGEIKLDVKEKILSNGMTILVIENDIAPVFSTYIRFKVGSADEHLGITGVSHLLEHLLFKGTKRIGTTNFEAEKPLMAKIDSLAAVMREEKTKLQNYRKGGSEDKVLALREEIAEVQAEQAQYIIKDELWETYLKNGGSGLNASTGNDGTQYYVSLPANRLELWAFMESDRIGNLQLREFYSERDVVREERRLRTETQARGRMYEALNAAAHWGSPYQWGVIGWGTDIDNMSRIDVEDYFKTYYHPGNTIACVVGDVKAEEVFSICEKYFGKIPAGPTPPPVYTFDEPQTGERRVDVEFDANPVGIAGWHMPQVTHPDVAALDVMSDILNRGRTSRLYKNITEKKFGRASAYISFSRYPDLFTCSVTPMGDYTVKDVFEAVYVEIDKLKEAPVEQWEIDKVRNQADADFVRSLASNGGMAYRIGNMTAMVGDWHYLIDYRNELKAVTPEDIMRVAKQYFTKSNRTVVTVVKKKKAEPSDNSNGPNL